MPASPADGDRYAQQVARLVDDLEAGLLRLLAQLLSKDTKTDTRTWAIERLAELQWLKTRAQHATAATMATLEVEIREAILAAYNHGTATAVHDLDRAGYVFTPGGLPATSTAVTLASEPTMMARRAVAMVPEILAAAYQQAVAAGATEVLGGGSTRLAASQRVLDGLLADGIRGFTDRRGRRWSLDTYIEMAVRSTTGQAAVAGHVAQLQAVGVDLVVVSDSPRECPLCRPWEGKVLSLSGQVGALIVPSAIGGDPVTVRVAGTLAEAKAAGLQHPNCFPAEVLVSAPSGVDAADSRWYEGDLAVIHTAGGDELPVTPNHPVLTPEGWVAAGALKVGDDVLRYRAGLRPEAVAGPHDEQVPARIGDVFDALRESSQVPPVRVPVAPEQFHGDGIRDTEVEVVLSDRLLQHRPHTGEAEDGGSDRPLLVGGVGHGALLPKGALGEVVSGSGHAPYRLVGAVGKRSALLDGHASGSTSSGLGPVGTGDSGPSEPVGEARLADADGGRSLALSLLAGEVTLDRVTEIGVRGFAGHVYNLQSGDGWYVASNIIVHNCTHRVTAYLPGATKLVAPQRDSLGYEAAQEQRGLERKVREWKRREALALTPEAAATARRKVRYWQGRIREHVDARDLKRLRYREQVGNADAALAH